MCTLIPDSCTHTHTHTHLLLPAATHILSIRGKCVQEVLSSIQFYGKDSRTKPNFTLQRRKTNFKSNILLNMVCVGVCVCWKRSHVYESILLVFYSCTTHAVSTFSWLKRYKITYRKSTSNKNALESNVRQTC